MMDQNSLFPSDEVVTDAADTVTHQVVVRDKPGPATADDLAGIVGTCVGSLIASEEDHSPNFLALHARLKATVASPRPGALLAVEVEAGRCYVVARVTNTWEHNPHEDAESSTLRDVLPIRTEYAHEGSSTIIFRIAAMEPLEEVLLDAAGNVEAVRSVESLPRAGHPVYEASEALVPYTLGLDPDPDGGLNVGEIEGSAGVAAVLKKETIQRHVFIAGAIGSGKGYTRGVLGEELHAWGVPQVNIDVNGEMVDAAKEMGGVNLRPGKDGFTLPLSAFTAADVINAVPSLNGNMIELVRHAHEELLKAARKSGKPFGVADLVAAIETYGPTLEMKSVTINPAKGRVESLHRFEYLGAPYDWQTALIPGAFINIDCRGLEVSDLRLIAAAVCRDIQRLARAKKIPFVVLSIDEFHLVAPAQEDTVARQVLREIARLGRHLRIGLILITQSPQDVDRPILKRLLTRFLHAIEPDQLDALRGVFSDTSEELVRQLPKLSQGTCILTGAFETVRHATVIHVRQRVTTHGGATPNIWADLAKAGWDKKRPVQVLSREP